MASRPFIASPQTSNEVQDARRDRSNLRTSTWSSTIRILFDLMELPHLASVTMDDYQVFSFLDTFSLFNGDSDMRTWRPGELGVALGWAQATRRSFWNSLVNDSCGCQIEIVTLSAAVNIWPFLF